MHWTFPWFSRVPLSKFEEIGPGVNGVIIGQTDKLRVRVKIKIFEKFLGGKSNPQVNKMDRH